MPHGLVILLSIVWYAIVLVLFLYWPVSKSSLKSVRHTKAWQPVVALLPAATGFIYPMWIINAASFICSAAIVIAMMGFVWVLLFDGLSARAAGRSFWEHESSTEQHYAQQVITEIENNDSAIIKTVGALVFIILYAVTFLLSP
jgi:hypothetical protein